LRKDGFSMRFFLTMVLAAMLALLVACGASPAEQAAEPTEPAEPTAEPTTAPTEPAEPTTEPTEAPTDEETSTENDTGSEAAAAPTEAPPTEAPEPTDAPPTATPEPTAEPTPSGPVALRSGQFNTIDNLHSGTGTATLVQQPDGSHVLRFQENFSVTFGPDLFVWLAGHPEPIANEDAQSQGWVNLGGLQSREGAQEYVIPPDVNVDEYQSALVWCRAFGQIMTSAPLTEE
jgi:hypothetical protein